MTTQLPSWQNRDGRSRTTPKGVVVFNAVLDTATVKKRQDRLRYRPGAARFKGTSLTGEYANEAFKIYQWEIALIKKVSPELSALTSASLARGVGSMRTQIPIVTTLVGEQGTTPGEVEDHVQFAGIVTQAPRDSGDTAATVMTGGLYTGLNQGPHAWAIGDTLQWAVPTAEEVNRIQAWSGNVANKLGENGRVTPILKPYRFNETDFFDPATVKQAIADAYDVPQKDDEYYNRKATLDSSLDPFSTRGQMAKAMRDLIQALAELVSAAYTYAGSVDIAVISDALIRIILSTNTKEGEDTSKIIEPASFATIATMRKDRPYAKMVSALAGIKQRVESKVVGRAVYGAPPGADTDIHLRAYAY